MTRLLWTLLPVTVGLALWNPGACEGQPKRSVKVGDQGAKAGSSRARMNDANKPSDRETLEEARHLVRAMALSAIGGDIQDYVGYLSDKDRERIERGVEYSQLSPLSQRFEAKWKLKYGKKFEDGLKDVELPFDLSSASDGSLLATLHTDGAKVVLRLVKGGWFGTSWRIDAPDSLQLRPLETHIEGTLSQLESMDLSEPEHRVYQKIAIKLLGPLAFKL